MKEKEVWSDIPDSKYQSSNLGGIRKKPNKTKKNKPNKNNGCVYFFRHKGLSPVKIGFSTLDTPVKRKETFETYAPFGVEVLGFVEIETPQKYEYSLHQKYADKRIRGEWFNISVEEVNQEIEELKKIQEYYNSLKS